MFKQGQNYHQLAVTCRASSEHPEMPQVVLLPCDSTSWTGTQVANHSWHDPLRSPSHEQDPRRLNALMSRVLRAAPLMLNEQSNIPEQRNRQPRPRRPSHPGKVWHLPAIWNHLHSDDSCGFQWRDVDAVTPEFPLDLQHTSPEYFRHLPRKHSPLTCNSVRLIAADYSFIYPEKIKGWVGLVGWPTADGLPT